jgi:diguanylate cyclase (GGDEF)-like protein/PAS domain S-box-containing protein
MNQPVSLFFDEESVIAHAESRLLAINQTGVSASDYAQLLERYKKLYRQSKRLIKMGDRMQSQLNRLNDELALSEEKYRSIFESSMHGIYRSTPEGRFLDINPAMARMFGYGSVDDMFTLVRDIGKDIYLEPRQRENFLRMLRQHRQLRDYPLKLRRLDGETIWVEVNVHGVFDENKNLVELEGLVADVTEKRRMLKKLQSLARRDVLTGQWNRRYFMELGQREMNRANREDSPLSLIFFDVDHFKAVNDTHGHDAGDAVLVELSRAVNSRLRDFDLFGRMGGEEFAVLLPGASIFHAVNVAEKLRSCIERTVVSTRGVDIRCTASLGVADRRPDRKTLQSLIQAADNAMYAAKHAGRNRIFSV